MTKYDTIGAGYNRKRTADPYLAERLLCLLQPQNDRFYLDIGCGTGNYTSILAGKGMNIVGVEPSERMLEVARLRNIKVPWLKGSAEEIPAGDKVFDGIAATLTIHHWTDTCKAFRELRRVLKEDGRLVIFTSTPDQMKGYWLNHYFPAMMGASVAQMPSMDRIENEIEQAGLKISSIEKYFIKDDLKDCFLYVGKNKPEYYFDPEIRNGISSFSSLANQEEVRKGLENLRSDITKNKFEEIRSRFSNDKGDYCFVTITGK